MTRSNPPRPRETIQAKSIKAICEIEQAALDRRTPGDRFADWIAWQASQIRFVAFHAVWFGGWLLWNSSFSPLRHFDPYPFSALSAMVALEAIFLSVFVLASESRNSRRADERMHLDLQISLIAEHEATKMLKMLRAICMHLNLSEANDPELAELIEKTRPEKLARELADQLPTHETPS